MNEQQMDEQQMDEQQMDKQQMDKQQMESINKIRDATNVIIAENIKLFKDFPSRFPYYGLRDSEESLYELLLIKNSSFLNMPRTQQPTSGIYGPWYGESYDMENKLLYACETGDVQLAQSMIENGAMELNDGFKCACNRGHLGVINLLISHGIRSWNWGLEHACLGGHSNVVQLMIEKGANNWNKGLERACLGGHLNVVQLMIEKGANNWDWGLKSACQGGHMEVVLFLIDKGANRKNVREYYNRFKPEDMAKYLESSMG
jgi:hypothetical protein